MPASKLFHGLILTLMFIEAATRAQDQHCALHSCKPNDDDVLFSGLTSGWAAGEPCSLSDILGGVLAICPVNAWQRDVAMRRGEMMNETMSGHERGRALPVGSFARNGVAFSARLRSISF